MLELESVTSGNNNAPCRFDRGYLGRKAHPNPIKIDETLASRYISNEVDKQSSGQILLPRNMVSMTRNCILEENKEPRASDCQENHHRAIFSNLNLHTLYRWHLLSTSDGFSRIGLLQGNLAI